MAFSDRVGKGARLARKHLQVRALETPGAVRLTRVVPTVRSGRNPRLRTKELTLHLDDVRTLKNLMYDRFALVDPSEEVVIILADDSELRTSGREFQHSLRSVAASAIRGGFGGAGGRVVMTGHPPPPGIPLKCSKVGCRYRVMVYYYDPSHPPKCAVHPTQKMVPA